MAKTPNYGLTTYTLNDDFRFVEYRMAEAGSGAESPSNMEIIDTQLKAVSDKVDETATDISNNYLPLAGGTMTGPIQMNTPSGYKVFIHPKASNTDNGWRLLAQSSDGTWGNGILTLNGSTGKWSLGECNADGWIDVQPANCGMKWTTNDGTIYYVKCYKPNNMFQITKKVGDAAETSVLSIYKDSATFVGNASTATSATSATKATQDASGNTITSSYGASINTSGNNIRLMSKSGAQLSSITVPYATNSGTSSSCSGNAATATTASNARKLNNKAESALSVSYASSSGTSSSCSGNAATATRANTAINSTNNVFGIGAGYIYCDKNQNMYISSEPNNSGSSHYDYRVYLGTQLNSPVAWGMCPAGNGSINFGLNGHRWNDGYFNGTVHCKTVNQTSDRRLKENINDIDEKYLKIFDNLKPSSYNFIGDDKVSTGYIAQDVEDAIKSAGFDSEKLNFVSKIRKVKTVDVIEEVVDTDEIDGDILGVKNTIEQRTIYVEPEDYNYSLDYSAFIPLNTAAIKRAEKKIQEQQTEINELKSALQALTEKVNQLSKG